jgi:hypothetical protein
LGTAGEQAKTAKTVKIKPPAAFHKNAQRVCPALSLYKRPSAVVHYRFRCVFVVEPYDQRDGGTALTRASVAVSYHGDIEGEGTLEYQMAYPGDDSATFGSSSSPSDELAGNSSGAAVYGLELPYYVEELEPGRSWAIAGRTLAAILQPYCNRDGTGWYETV